MRNREEIMKNVKEVVGPGNRTLIYYDDKFVAYFDTIPDVDVLTAKKTGDKYYAYAKAVNVPPSKPQWPRLGYFESAGEALKAIKNYLHINENL